MMFDINGHYVFNSLDRFEFYGLAGLNITFAKLKWLGTGASSDSDNALGSEYWRRNLYEDDRTV